MRLLVLEDDHVLLNGLKVGLQILGFTVDTVSRVADAQAALQSVSFDAAVLDVMLPDGSGIDVLQTMRRRGDDTPVIVLTARDAVGDRIEGLDAGADDYLAKPFDLDELAARLRAITRRKQGRAKRTLTCMGITIDPARMSTTLDGQAIALSRHEFIILHALMTNPGHILSKATIEEKLYGWQEDVESNTIEVHIHKLRSKLGALAIETVRGVGYRVRTSK